MINSLRSLEQQWIKEGKTKAQIRRLRYYHKNRKKIRGEMRSLRWAGNGRDH